MSRSPSSALDSSLRPGRHRDTGSEDVVVLYSPLRRNVHVPKEDLAAAQSQLRHTSPQTTMKYDQAPVEDRRSALDKMG